MNARRQSTFVLVLGGLFLLAGILHLGSLIVWNGWPTLHFALFFAAGGVLLLAGIWARRGAPTWPRRHVGWLAGIGVAAGIGTWVIGTGQTERRSFEMRWSYGDPATNRDGEPHVVLTYLAAPACREGFYSRALAEYLEGTGDSVVTIELQITRDFGRLRGYRIARLGPYADRAWGWGYSACGGNCPHPARNATTASRISDPDASPLCHAETP